MSRARAGHARCQRLRGLEDSPSRQRLRRPAQSHAGDIATVTAGTDRRRPRHELENVTLNASPRQARLNRQGQYHHGQQRQPEEGRRARIGQIKAQIEDTTSDYDEGSSKRAGKAFAASPSSKSAAPPRSRLRSAKTGSKTPCTPRRPLKKGSCLAAAWRFCVLPRPWTNSSLRTRTEGWMNTSARRCPGRRG